MNFRCIFSLSCLCLCAASPTQAGILVKFTETTNGVVISGSGSISTLDGLSYLTSTNLVSANQYFHTGISAHIRSTGQEIDFYYADSDFTSFSSLGTTTTLAADPGYEFGVTSLKASNPQSTAPDRVYLPKNYQAGDVLSFSILNAGMTLADFGLSAGDTWGAVWLTGNSSQPSESMLFQALRGSSTVPEPGTASLAIVGLGCLCQSQRRRRSRSQAVSRRRLR